MIIKKKIGEFELIDSGSIVIDKANTVSFFLDDLEIEIVFFDRDDKKQEIKAIPVDTKKLQLQLINFNNPLGTGPTKPLNIATLNTGECVYLQYVVYAIHDMKILHYSWYSKFVVKGDIIPPDDSKPEIIG